MPNLITFTLDPIYAGNTYNPGPFNIYGYDVNSNVILIASNVPKQDLINGVQYTVNDGITNGYIQSTGVCTNQITWQVTITTPPVDPISNYGKTYEIRKENAYFEGIEVRYRNMSDTVVTVFIQNITDFTDYPDKTRAYRICVKQGGTYNVPECVYAGQVISCIANWVQIGICQ